VRNVSLDRCGVFCFESKRPIKTHSLHRSPAQTATSRNISCEAITQQHSFFVPAQFLNRCQGQCELWQCWHRQETQAWLWLLSGGWWLVVAVSFPEHCISSS
jgi:hypothetical protein